MIKLRRADERGKADIGWLKSFHSFSFADYYDPNHMGFGHLRVINDDIIMGGGGFGEHPHRDMEIVTYVIDGELAHKDSMGNIATIKSGEVQRMSAGTGVRHSEFNASKSNPVRLLQIWFHPANKGDKPSYEQKMFTRKDKVNNLKLVVSNGGKDGAVDIHQDVNIYASVLEEGKTLTHDTGGRYLWLQLASGEIEVNGNKLTEGDGLAIAEEKQLSIKGIAKESEFVIFSMGK